MQQQGGSRYGVPPPEMGAPFSSGSQAGQQQQQLQQPRTIRIPPGIEYLQHQQQQAAPEAASPISSRPPPPPPGSIFEEYSVGTAGGGFPDEEALGAGEEAERAGGAGNRWPRQETLALLKIRSDMDAAFRDATLKGPLWDDVSRKLAELGYARSAKKCKEKFENVHKYYKRTKEGRAGRQDGKSYRFFSQLEAIQSYTGGGGGGGQAISGVSPLTQNTAGFPAGISSALVSSAVSPPQVNVSSSSLALPGSTMKTAPGLRIQPPGFSSIGEIPVNAPAPAAAARISFSSNTSSSSASDTDGDETEEGVAGAGAMQDDGRKRKREGWPGGGSRKMMAFFDGLMKQVMERQELMQQRFFETIEKREQDRMIREEAWKRQEMARLNREYELMAQERAVAASRDAAVISFLEKFSGCPANQPPVADPTISAAIPPQPSPAAVPPPPSSPQQLQQLQQPKPPAPPVEFQLHPPAMEFDDNTNNERNQLLASSEPASTAAAMSEATEAMVCGGGSCLDTISPSLSSSRWPKPEVIALIKLRSGLETRYLEAGPKGPLWEEISHGMKLLGYSRNAKRCKEKWENINKYFKKVKESNKKRPDDAKTCPYFHELDALYRKKQLNSGAAATASGIITEQQQEPIREPLRTLEPISAPIEKENSNGQNKSTAGNHGTGGDQIHRNNGAGIPRVFFGGAPGRGGAAEMKKPEDIIRQLMEQKSQPRPALIDYRKLGDPADSDTINPEYDDEDEDYDDEEEEEEGKLRYEIQFQRQGAGSSAAGNATGKVAAAASPAGSFLAMVQ